MTRKGRVVKTRKFRLTERSVMKVEMDDNGELYFYARDITAYDEAQKWENYGTDLIPLIETHGSSKNVIGAVFEAQSVLLKITQWFVEELCIDENEMTEAERESQADDHYYETKHDCEKEAQSWLN